MRRIHHLRSLAFVTLVAMVRARSRRAKGGAAAAVAGGALAATTLCFGAGCLTSNGIAPSGDGGTEASAVVGDPTKNEGNKDGIPYRDLDGHPGCSVVGLDTRKASAYVPATIPGYKCAAKAYPLVAEDTQKPIVLLVHGNSSTPGDWERFPAGDPSALPMLADRLSAQHFRVLAVDVRYDLTDDPKGNNKTENAGQNFDHGWAVPIVQHFIESVMTAFPDRQLSLVAFSVGPTITRDALRRLHREGKKPYEHFKDLVFAAGSHHGVSSFRTLCGSNPTMRGKIACELGDRVSFQPTDFLTPNNGPGGAWETPCSDADTAYGQKAVCGGHKVSYTTVVMKDVSQGTYQDEFVSEGSSMLNGANNTTIGLTDNDLSNYFYNGLFKNHMGSIRSDAALKIIVKALGGDR
jgi:pimeloyl-ACP methyl ester carboxylesterase